jgi:hypothetical protein
VSIFSLSCWFWKSSHEKSYMPRNCEQPLAVEGSLWLTASK